MKNEFLRHTLSTISYRFDKSVKEVDKDFENFRIGIRSRTPNEIINHMFHVLNATRIFIETEKFLKEQPENLDLNSEIERFNLELKHLDKILSEKQLDINYSKRLIQGPLSDLLSHIGQISMLSGLVGKPIIAEDFSKASISTGIV